MKVYVEKYGIYWALAAEVTLLCLMDYSALTTALFGLIVGAVCILLLGAIYNEVVYAVVHHYFFRDVWVKKGNLFLLILIITYFFLYVYLAKTDVITLTTPFPAIAGFMIFAGGLTGLGFRISRMTH